MDANQPAFDPRQPRRLTVDEFLALTQQGDPHVDQQNWQTAPPSQQNPTQFPAARQWGDPHVDQRNWQTGPANRPSFDQFLGSRQWGDPHVDHQLGQITPFVRQNMEAALNFFQNRLSPCTLWQQIRPSPWTLRIQGSCYRLVSYMQGINFSVPVDPHRVIADGSVVHGFPGETLGLAGGWFLLPSAGDQATPHGLRKYRAKLAFTCLQSTVADTYCAWRQDGSPSAHPGRAQQLFIPDAPAVLEPLA